MLRQKVLLTGPPRVGKTTLIQRTLTMLTVPAGGFFTREIRLAGQRAGFEIVTLDGNKAVLASTDVQGRSDWPSLGRYAVNVDAVDNIAVPALNLATAAGKLVVIDEIGPMEILSPLFQETIWQIVESNAVVLGTVVSRRYQFADAVKQHRSVHIMQVSRENREMLAVEIARRLKG